jgi:hypothetical protein
MDKAHWLFGTNFSQGPSLDPLSEFVDRDKQVGEAPGHFLEWSQEVQANMAKGHVMEMVWSSWASTWICLAKYWHPLQDLLI